ncbi:hypothetical protein SNEBB_009983 [Seison nebaliae]|nr:hypothetical protein SNEBB_009983 [Seison nebaliae]
MSTQKRVVINYLFSHSSQYRILFIINVIKLFIWMRHVHPLSCLKATSFFIPPKLLSVPRTMSSAFSCVLSTTVSLSLFATAQLYGDVFIQNERLIVLGGFFCSLIFLFTTIAVGNFLAIFSSPQRVMNILPDTLLSFVISAVAASSIHRVCVTTSFLFNMGWLYLLNCVADKYYGTGDQTEKSSKKRR